LFYIIASKGFQVSKSSHSQITPYTTFFLRYTQLKHPRTFTQSIGLTEQDSYTQGSAEQSFTTTSRTPTSPVCPKSASCCGFQKYIIKTTFINHKKIS